MSSSTPAGRDGSSNDAPSGATGGRAGSHDGTRSGGAGRDSGGRPDATGAWRASAEPIEHARTDDYTMGRWNGLFILVWKRETTMEAISELRASLDRLCRAHTEGVALMTIVEAEAPLPPSDVRKALADVLASFGKEVKASAVVFEGHGFRASAVRSVVTGLTLLARPPFPHKVFANVVEAADWMGPLLPGGVTPPPSAIARAVRALRQ